MTQPTGAQQIAQIKEQLLQAFCRLEDAQVAVERERTTIKALRNTLGGIPLGQQIAEEIAAESAAAQDN
jgi:hypothetical protein